jgi:hypothetical protein
VKSSPLGALSAGTPALSEVSITKNWASFPSAFSGVETQSQRLKERIEFMNTHLTETVFDLGDVHDNTEVLTYALSKKQDDPQMSLQILLALRNHIEKTEEASSVAFLKPQVLQAISSILTGH